MMRNRLSLLVVCLVGAWATNGLSAEPAAKWIWSKAEREGSQPAVFRRVVKLEQAVTRAFVFCQADSARCQLVLNGMQVLELQPYSQTAALDVTSMMRKGDNELEVRAVGVAGPSAVVIDLRLRMADNSEVRVASDSSWLVDERPALEFGAADERLFADKNRRVGITAVDNYEQWKRALKAGEGAHPATFVTSPGFEISLVRSAQPGEGSWVSLTFDPTGRAIIAKEKQGLLRMTLSSSGDAVQEVEVINSTLKECRGLLFAHNSLYANANNSKALYRLKRNDADRYAEPELLYASEGGVGHGRNDITLGPDGKLHVIHGDSVRIPKSSTDYTSPFRKARQGKPSSEGHWLRIDPKTKQVEVMCGGLRNPYGIAMNSDGDVFTYDADAEYDMGAPWYRPTRVNHLVAGGDYGWRGVTGQWPPYYCDHPDNAPANLDIGKGSPTAVMFGTDTQFPEPFRRALFVLDWAYGRIVAVHMWPRGASYMMAAETFLKGSPLNVTDIAAAPNGSMYLVTGGRGTQSSLYRIRYVGAGQPNASRQLTVQQRERQRFAHKSHHRRKQLESQLRKAVTTQDDVNDAWRSLGDADPWIRYAARNVLERCSADDWLERALAEEDRRVAITALTAVVRSGRAMDRVLARLNVLDWQEEPSEFRRGALYCYWLGVDTLEDTPSLASAARVRLGRVIPSTDREENRLLSELIVKLDMRTHQESILQRLERSDQTREKIHNLFALRHAKGLTVDQRRRYFNELAAASGYLGGRGLPDFLRRIREESLAATPESMRGELQDVIQSPADIEPPPAPTREFVRKWRLADLAANLDFAVDKSQVQRGRRLFVAAACSQCHRAEGVGRAIGPDLGTVGRRFSRRDMLVSMLEPSRVIAEKYRSLQVLTTDGKSFVGRVAAGGDYRSPILRIAVDPNRPFHFTEINKDQIEQQRPSPTSWMPSGLLDTLTESEVHDLLAYLESLARD